jgi:hypothetical protein
MRTKTLIILVVILGILAGALLIRLKSPERSQGRLGANLFQQLPVNKIMSIAIKGADGDVFLMKKSERWVVANRFDYPANFSKIIDLVRRLKDAKVGRQFTSSEDTLRRLSLKDPEDSQAPRDAKGTRIVLRVENEKPLATVLVGKTRKTGEEGTLPEGQYVTLGQDQTVYLIDSDFPALGKRPTDWLDKDLARVKSSEVKRISSIKDKGKRAVYTFERAEKGGDLKVTHLPAGRKIDKSKLNRLSDALSFLSMEDVVDPSKAEESVRAVVFDRLEYSLFNGTIYRVYVGKGCSETGPCYLKLQVDYQRPSEGKEEPAQGGAGKGEKAPMKKGPEEYAQEAKQANDRLSPWVYVIPKREHTAFITDIEGLLEKS